MKKIIALTLLSGTAFAFNPVTDVRDNLKWTLGKTAEAGTAIKLAGAGDLDNGDTTTSVLAGVFDYRWFTFSYGGTKINRANQDFTDTAKIGLRLTSFFDFFKNPPTPEMGFLRNVNIGPSFASPIFSSNRAGTLFLDFNYQFGGI